MTVEHDFNFRGPVPGKMVSPMGASKVIQRGNIVCLDTSGNALEGTTIAGGANVALGRAQSKVDNTGGAAAALDVEVQVGILEWMNSSGDPIDKSSVGQPVYVESEATVAKTSSSGTLIAAGIMTEITAAGKIAVFMGPAMTELATAVAEGAAGVSMQKRTATVGHAALTAAATTQTLSVGAVLPANARVIGVELDGFTPFTGGSVSAIKIDVGTSGDIQALVKQADGFAAAIDGQTSSCPLGNAPNKNYATAGAQLQVKFTSTGDNLVNLTAGTVTVTVLFAVLA